MAILGSRWLLPIPALVAITAYLPSLDFALVWDDVVFLRETPLYTQPDRVAEALQRPFAASPNYFRPLGVLSFLLQQSPDGPDPRALHAANVALHGIATALVTLLAYALARRARPHADAQRAEEAAAPPVAPAVVAGLLYGLHPALVEGVAFVSSRFDLLVTVLLLLALLIDTTVRHRGVRAAGVGAAFLLAALAKEMAFAFALALPCWHLARGSLRELAPSALAVGLAGAAALAFRFASLGYLLVPEATIATGDGLQHALLVAKTLATYLQLVAWPFGALSPIHPLALPVPVDDPASWLPVLATALLALGLVVAVRRAPASGWLAVSAVAALLPVLNLLPLRLGGGSYAAERFLLFPLSLLVLAIAGPLTRTAWVSPAAGRRRGARLALALGGVAWLAASALTLESTLRHWRSDATLWSFAARTAPASALPHANLAVQHLRAGEPKAALAAARTALALDPDQADAAHDAGLALLHLQRPEEAERAFRRALERAPDRALFWNSLANALRVQGKLDEAEGVLENEVLAREPSLGIAHLNLGALYLDDDRPDEAEARFEQARGHLQGAQLRDAERLLETSREPARWLRLGNRRLREADPAGALTAFERAGTLGAPRLDVLMSSAGALVRMQSWARADTLLREAARLAPSDAGIQNNRGIVARERGDLDAARAHFARAAALAPEWELPRRNLEALR